jgi:hypothetical protein
MITIMSKFYTNQQLKEQCERVWKELPLAYPCNLAAWLPNEDREQLNLGFYVGAKGLTSLKGKRMQLKGLRKLSRVHKLSPFYQIAWLTSIKIVP